MLLLVLLVMKSGLDLFPFNSLNMSILSAHAHTRLGVRVGVIVPPDYSQNSDWILEKNVLMWKNGL